MSDANLSALLWMNLFARHTPWLHGVVAAFAAYAPVLFGALLVAACWQRRHADTDALTRAVWAGLACLVAVGVNQPLVHLVHETRPYVAHPELLVLATRSTDPSFPSDHATMAGAVAVGLFLVGRRLGTVAAVAGLLLAASRVYIAAHYPWDVVAGLALGALVAGLGWLAIRPILVPLIARLRALPGLRAVACPSAPTG